MTPYLEGEYNENTFRSRDSVELGEESSIN